MQEQPVSTPFAAPADFLWGAATAAYQIEGAVGEDGRGPTVWDTFAHTPGKIERGETGDSACDHYHRWQPDVARMAMLGLRAYRFSIAWSRILPSGEGAVNAAGLDFYDRLVDALLAKQITPMVTLFHWDLPQALQDKGGWLNRDTSAYLGAYADVVTRRLGDRVRHWITLNEPFIHTYYGHVEGVHAPGTTGLEHAIPVMHHLLLGHGLALQSIRANVADAQVGVAFSLAKIEPASERVEDAAAVDIADAFVNTFCLDPIVRGQYSPVISSFVSAGLVRDDDMAIIGAPIDIIGVNYYQRVLVRASTVLPGFEQVPPESNDLTEMGNEVYPAGLDYWLRRTDADYPGHTIMVTENGVSFPDHLEPTGAVHDSRRTAYLRAHIQVALRAMADGIPLRGYFIWSLMDNFEWAFGFRPRFGLFYTDFATQERHIKDSGRWLAHIIATGQDDPQF